MIDDLTKTTDRLVYDMGFQFYQSLDQKIFEPLMEAERLDNMFVVFNIIESWAGFVSFRMTTTELKEVFAELDSIKELVTFNAPRAVAANYTAVSSSGAHRRLRDLKIRLLQIMDRNGMLMKKAIYRDEFKVIEKELGLKDKKGVKNE